METIIITNCFQLCSASPNPPLSSLLQGPQQLQISPPADSPPPVTLNFTSRGGLISRNSIHPRLLPPANAPGEHFPFLFPWGWGWGWRGTSSPAQPLLWTHCDFACQLPWRCHAPSLQCNTRVPITGILQKSSLHLPLRQPSPTLACFFPHLDSHLTPLVTATCLHRHQGQFWLLLPFPASTLQLVTTDAQS